MKPLYKLIQITGPLTLALLLSVNANAAAVSSTVPNISFQQELTVGGGEDEKTEAKAEAKKPLKPKKLKARRVNHGPKRPIFPGTDRKKDKLSRARHLNARR